MKAKKTTAKKRLPKKSSMICPNCGEGSYVIDVKSYKSFQHIEGVKNMKLITYIHRWRNCTNCGTVFQTAEHIIPDTIVINNYEDLKRNLPYRDKKRA